MLDPATTPLDDVVGRDHELASVEAFLADSHARVLLIEGEAGIGKTTLWRAAVHAARGRGYRVLASSASGSETQLSFTALHDLLDGAFDEVADELPPPERSAIAVAVLNVLRLVGSQAATVIALDDVHWLDAASASPLAYALRRLGDEPVRFLLAVRP